MASTLPEIAEFSSAEQQMMPQLPPPPPQQSSFSGVAAAAAPVTIEQIERELSVLSALPRAVRCRRVVPEAAFAMLETLIQRLLAEADQAAQAMAGATFAQPTAAPGTKKGCSKQAVAAAAVVAPPTRPGSVVFLERADVWCDLLDDFAQTVQQYGSNVPLTAHQLSVLNSVASPESRAAPLYAAAGGDDDAAAVNSVLLSNAAFVDGAHTSSDHNQAQQQIPKTKGPDSLAVNTAQSVDRDSLATQQHLQRMRSVSPARQQQQGGGVDDMRARSPAAAAALNKDNNATIASLALTATTTGGANGSPSSPLRHSESEMNRLVEEHLSHETARSKLFTAQDSNVSTNKLAPFTSALPARRALLLKIQTKERLRDVFVQMAADLAATIKAPRSVFAPPAVEKAMRDLQALQAEASKFAALTVELYGALEQELQQLFQAAFGRATQLAGDRAWTQSVSDRSRRDRTQRTAHLVTDVYLMLAAMDARRGDASVLVAKALLALAGLESRRHSHDAALQLATDAVGRLGKLYAKEATTINEFRATASAEAMQQQTALALLQDQQQQLNSSGSALGGNALLAPSSAQSTFRFLCQVHDAFGPGFPAPLELISDEQRDAMGAIIGGLQRRLNAVIPLRVAAHFNRASELEHLHAPASECRVEYTAALTAGSSPRLPDFALLPQNPLMVRVSDALASMVAHKMEQNRAARFAVTNSNNPNQKLQRASSANLAQAALPPLTSGFGAGGGGVVVPRPPPSSGDGARTARTPNAAAPVFSRVYTNSNAAAAASSATTNRSARMIGGSEFSKHVTSEEVAHARESATNSWQQQQQDGGGGADNRNLEMLKKFGIVPENTQLTRKSQPPIASVAHLDDNFIADPVTELMGQQQQQQGADGLDGTLGRSRAGASVVQPLGADASGRRGTLRSGMGADPQQQQQQLITAPLDKALEEKLSGRQAAMLSGVHGLLEARGAKIHARYEAELDSVVVRCKQAFVQRDRAARVIQRAWRCAVARLEAFNRRQVFYHFLYQAQKAAGTAILTTYRKHRQQAAFAQKRDDLRQKRQRLAQEELRRRRAVMTIARAIRRFKSLRLQEADLMRRLRIHERERLLRTDIAAAIVQRWWKLVKHEARYWRRRNDDLRREQLEAARALQLHAAATTVQRVYRGHLGRYDARVVRAQVMDQRMALRRAVHCAADTVRTVLQEYRARTLRLEMLASQQAVKAAAAQRTIRGGWYHALERRKMKIVRARARELSLAARRLQCWWRGIRARRELRYRRKVAQTMTMVRIKREWAQLRAARVIQGAWRIHAAKRVLRRLRAGVGRELINAIWTLQSAGRAFFVRRALCEERALLRSLVAAAFAKAATFRNAQVVLVQRCMYPVTSQLLCRALLERRLREKLLVWRGMREEQRADRRAQALQSVGRGFLVRSAVMPALQRAAAELATRRTAAAATIQRGWKCGAARDDLRRRKEARARLVVRQQEWVELSESMHDHRVASLALMEQGARMGVARLEKHARCVVLAGFFRPFVQQEQKEQRGVTAGETATGTTAAASAAAAATAGGDDDSDSEAAQQRLRLRRRVLDMYDDSDEEKEKNELVARILGS